MNASTAPHEKDREEAERTLVAFLANSAVMSCANQRNSTMHEHAAAAWPLAVATIAQTTSESCDTVRAFLDNWHGRHFADDVRDRLHVGDRLEDAVRFATALDDLDHQPQDQSRVRHSPRAALPARHGDPLRDRRGRHRRLNAERGTREDSVKTKRQRGRRSSGLGCFYVRCRLITATGVVAMMASANPYCLVVAGCKPNRCSS